MDKLPSFDIYAELGVNPEAPAEDIKRAYRWLARRFHPDNGSGSDAERFKRVALAYEVLRDPDSRARYDRLRSVQPIPDKARRRRQPNRRPSPAVSTWRPKTSNELKLLLLDRIAYGPAMTKGDLKIIKRLATRLGMDLPDGFTEPEAEEETEQRPGPPYTVDPKHVRELLLIGGRFVRKARAANHTLQGLEIEFLDALAHNLGMSLDAFMAEAEAVTNATDQPVP